VGLAGAYALPLGDPETGGLARMLTLVVVTRLHNAAAAAAGMRRGLAYARAYARTRTVSSGRLDRNPLHRTTLAGLAVDALAAFALAAHAFVLLGQSECDGDAAAERELRLVAPLAKLATDPAVAITSGQWMTESQGGSDIGRSTTVARPAADGSWRVTGEKWFCSAADSAMAVALAAPHRAAKSSHALAPFLIPRYAADSPLAAASATLIPDATRNDDRIALRNAIQRQSLTKSARSHPKYARS
jgi:alkylation response protein AidB-like acyl-CoA dehydrogenase